MLSRVRGRLSFAVVSLSMPKEKIELCVYLKPRRRLSLAGLHVRGGPDVEDGFADGAHVEEAGGETCARGVEEVRRADGAAVFGTTGEGWVSQRV